MTRFIFTLLLFLPFLGAAQNYGDYGQLVSINFESGTVADALGNVDPETGNGAVVVEDNDRSGRVLKFDAQQEGYLELPSEILADTLTISFWGKREDANPEDPWRMFLALYAPDGSNIYLTPHTSWDESSYLILENMFYNAYKTLKGTSLQNEKWVHFAVVFSGNRVKFYVDGVLQAEIQSMFVLSDYSFNRFFFGNNPLLNYPMSGRLDDIKIFHSELAGNQVRALAEGETVPPPAGNSSFAARFSFENGFDDDLGNTTSTAAGLTREPDLLRGMVAVFSEASELKIPADMLGQEEFSVNFLLKNNPANEMGEDGILLKITGENGDAVVLKACGDIFSPAGLCLEVVKNGVLSSDTISAKLTLDVWNSVTLVQTGGSTGTPYFRLYLNGVFVKSVAGIETATLASGQIVFGDNGNAWPGFIDEITVSNKALPVSEVLQLYNALCTTVDLNIDTSTAFQTIQNFGASDGWSTQHIGLHFPENKKERLAELLFSQDTFPDGTPKGIGLSSWRFNIGAGTAEQGDESRISIETRRTECFLNPDRETYNWNKQAGQQWFLEKAAKTYQVEDIIGWQNSPPVYFTVRGLGFREYGDPVSTILKEEHYHDFGRFLADVVSHFKQEGIHLKYISPLNEPQWGWAPSEAGGTVTQEGTPWTNQEIYEVVQAIDSEFNKQNTDAQLFIGESGSINYLLAGSSGHAANQLATFWDAGSSQSLVGLEYFSDYVSSHSYGTDGSANNIISARQQLKEQMEEKDPSLEYWQTEYCLLGNGYKWGHTDGMNSSLSPMESAISMCRIIHSDLTVADCTGWQWWTTFESETLLGQEDRYALIRYLLNNEKSDGVYHPTKLLYALGNYSRFVRPGMKRIEITQSDDATPGESLTGQMFSAYFDEKKKNVVVVAVNASTSERIIRFDETESLADVEAFVPYVTTDREGDNLKKYPPVKPGEGFTLPGTSVVTFVGGTLDVNTAVREKPADISLNVYPNPVANTLTVRAGAAIERLYLYDLSGRELQAFSPRTLTFSFDTKGLHPGVYILRVDSGGNIQSVKIVKR